MLSLIISSKNTTDFANISQNISKTIGVDFEIIKLDNYNGEFGICNIYNSGALKAKFDNLCFLHEDLIFNTQNWGQLLIDHLNNENIGIIGLAGSVYKAHTLGGWINNIEINETSAIRCNYFQHYKFTQNDVVHKYSNPFNEFKSEVITIDGLFMACKKEIWLKNKFEEKLLTNFHGYDLDFSLQIAKIKKNYVVYNINVEHLSEGKMTSEWYLANLKIHKKFKAFLPIFASTAIIEKKCYWNFYKKENNEWLFIYKYLVQLKKEGKTKSKQLNLLIKALSNITYLPVNKIKFKYFLKILSQIIR